MSHPSQWNGCTVNYAWHPLTGAIGLTCPERTSGARGSNVYCSVSTSSTLGSLFCDFKYINSSFRKLHYARNMQ